MSRVSSPVKALGVSFTLDDFNALSHHARRHEMPVREFVEYMAKSYITAMQQPAKRVQGSKNLGR